MMGRCEIFIRLLSDKFDTFYNTYACLDEELDIESVVDIVCDWIKEDVEQEVCEMIEKLPKDILNKIKITKSDVNIERADVEGYVESYLEPSELEYDHHEMNYDYGIAGEMDVLDCIFKQMLQLVSTGF